MFIQKQKIWIKTLKSEFKLSKIINNMFSNLSLKHFSSSTTSNSDCPPKFEKDCGKESCGCKSTQPEEDTLERHFRSLNYKIIQCINLGSFQDALDLSEDYIEQLKTNYSNILYNKFV